MVAPDYRYGHYYFNMARTPNKSIEISPAKDSKDCICQITKKIRTN